MFINKELIVLELQADSKADAIRKLAMKADSSGKLYSLEQYVDSVMARENEYSTGVGNGIAIPHGKSSGVKEAVIVFGKLKTPLEWESLDGNLVEMIFLLGVPEENVDNLHLKILSQLSRRLMDDNFVQTLKCAVSNEDVLRDLEDINPNNA